MIALALTETHHNFVALFLSTTKILRQNLFFPELFPDLIKLFLRFLIHLHLQHVDEENAYLCGYLKIKNLTDEYPEMVTFFDGEIISEKHPFLTRKWDADEDVDRKHWVRIRMFWIR